MLNTTQTTNPSCVTRTEPLTAAEKEFREHSIKGHRPKLKMHVDKSCHECVTPVRQALRCQKEGALEEPDIESADEDEEDEEMGIHTMDKCTSCDRLTDTQCMNLLCEWCCESQDCECIAVPIPKPRSMIATRGTDTVSSCVEQEPSMAWHARMLKQAVGITEFTNPNPNCVWQQDATIKGL